MYSFPLGGHFSGGAIRRHRPAGIRTALDQRDDILDHSSKG
jgi:hypothetical protein